jgi:hypothetical protein
LRFRHFLDCNLALGNSIDEHGRAGTCRHVGTFQEIDLIIIVIEIDVIKLSIATH